jgi:hypothetical protein
VRKSFILIQAHPTRNPAAVRASRASYQQINADAGACFRTTG